MKLNLVISTSSGQQHRVPVSISDGEFVTHYGIDLEVPVDDAHPNGYETIMRQSFIMSDQDETEEEIKEDIEPIYVQVDLYERSINNEREKFATWRMPLDILLTTQFPPTQNQPDASRCAYMEIEIKRFKMTTMEGK